MRDATRHDVTLDDQFVVRFCCSFVEGDRHHCPSHVYRDLLREEKWFTVVFIVFTSITCIRMEGKRSWRHELQEEEMGEQTCRSPGDFSCDILSFRKH